ncbi:MAG: TetR family transcriptional regulator C-terminal domain-containing protein [Gammaproteobacteria bacterium]|nr:TetR family transcriptional regulator C-terminal domain-containing protein [Gammaproteobacteria bacterium]MDH4255336.1 TetR family transcriptional regulator C-terminal domain-containing protein [Gammaproteobacteria bacterium]MDH5310659.1 TetR family transcriptional regulator C-terminal domain-containing protein [Gammaproteobacteria bacterium]
MARSKLEMSRRTAARAARRQQLIDATMKCIARKGIGSTTLADVAKEAGLSQGIVNLHFLTKENLLNETLQCLAGEYQAQFESTLAKSGPGAAEKLLALVELDFRPSICDRRKLAVWFAFWGEVQSVPTYRKICDELDKHYDQEMVRLCESLITEARYEDLDPVIVCDALSAMTNGLWLSCLISPKTWDRHKAKEAAMTYLRGVFPEHYKK